MRLAPVKGRDASTRDPWPGAAVHGGPGGTHAPYSPMRTEPDPMMVLDMSPFTAAARTSPEENAG